MTVHRVLVVGSGGREHALCRALAAATDVDLLAAPGNTGTMSLARSLPIRADDIEAIVAAATSEGVSLVVIGSESPLVAGLADALAGAGVACCGPTAAAARLEGSKAFTRTLAGRAGVPGPEYRIVDGLDQIDEALDAFDVPPVVKADGLAAGKGVVLPDTMDDCRTAIAAMLGGRLGRAGRRVVLEDRLTGTEASLFFACRGTTAISLPHARDYKRLGTGDLGPNTGGMGAISPNPTVDADIEASVVDQIVGPTLVAMEQAGVPFSGFLYAGVMLTENGPMLLEYNVRLGDPEAQAILPRMEPGAFAETCRWAAGLHSDPPSVRRERRSTCAVVVAAVGYPEAPRSGDPIEIDPGFDEPDRWFIHAGTGLADGTLITTGGRVGAVVAVGADGESARQRAYEGVGLVTFRDMTFRTDIGAT